MFFLMSSCLEGGLWDPKPGAAAEFSACAPLDGGPGPVGGPSTGSVDVQLVGLTCTLPMYDLNPSTIHSSQTWYAMYRLYIDSI